MPGTAQRHRRHGRRLQTPPVGRPACSQAASRPGAFSLSLRFRQGTGNHGKRRKNGCGQTVGNSFFPVFPHAFRHILACGPLTCSPPGLQGFLPGKQKRLPHPGIHPAARNLHLSGSKSNESESTRYSRGLSNSLHFTCRSLTGILAINIAILILLCFLEQSNSEIKKLRQSIQE